MCRVQIQITVRINEFKHLKLYLLDNIGDRFSSDFKVVHKDIEKDFMNVEIDLENGTAAYLLGRLIGSYPISNYIKSLNNG